MRKKWKIVLAVAVGVAMIVAGLYFSWRGLVDLNSTEDTVGGDTSMMDMSDFLDEHISYVPDMNESGIYGAANAPVTENIDLSVCRVEDTSPGIAWIDVLRRTASSDGAAGLKQMIDWTRVSAEEHSSVVDMLEQLSGLLCSDVEIFIIQETKVDGAYMFQLCGLHPCLGVEHDKMYDYSNAEYVTITVFSGEDGSFQFVPYAII